MNTIKEFSHPDLGVRIDVKNVVLSTLLLLLGIGLTYFSLNLAILVLTFETDIPISFAISA